MIKSLYETIGIGETILCLAVSDDNDLISGSINSFVSIWDIDTGIIRQYRNISDNIEVIEILDNESLVWGYLKGAIIICSKLMRS